MGHGRAREVDLRAQAAGATGLAAAVVRRRTRLRPCSLAWHLQLLIFLYHLAYDLRVHVHRSRLPRLFHFHTYTRERLVCGSSRWRRRTQEFTEQSARRLGHIHELNPSPSIPLLPKTLSREPHAGALSGQLKLKIDLVGGRQLLTELNRHAVLR